ncbi:MAG: PH domain-containing protein [Clostridiaceae bacterium]|nr:PH domain-containing protein [Clostridiaceae bacterium]
MRKLLEKDPEKAFSSMILLPKSVSFQSQDDGEDVYILLRQHWAVNLPSLIKVLLGIIFPFIVIFIISVLPGEGELFPVSYIICAWIAWYIILLTYSILKFLSWYFNAYIITSDRIVDLDFYGLLSHKISSASLLNIEDVSSGHFGLWQNLFDFGTVRIQTAAETAEFRFDNVPKPGYVKDKIMDLALLLKREK